MKADAPSTLGELQNEMRSLGVRVKATRRSPNHRWTAVVGFDKRHAGGVGTTPTEAIVEALTLYRSAFKSAVAR
jgi:hypothetical protein